MTSIAAGLVLGFSMACSVAAAEDTGAISALGQSGYFRVTAHSQLTPIPINQMHSWILQVESAAGSPVPAATIEVAGGMPAHDHGLPTAPRVTKNLNDGRYLVEGIRFHMNGSWEISVTVATDEQRDVVVLNLEL